jgi:FMN-dependent NADH-azoreductase
MTILQINSSIHGADAASTQLAGAIAAQLGGEVVLRDLAAQPIPHLDAETFSAFSSPGEAQSEHATAGVARSDQLIEELRAADTVILAVPMYNFGIPSALKAWIDHIARAGVTFRYTAEGPRGLLGDKRVIVVATRGGQYAGTGADNQSAYLRQVLGFIGLGEPEFVYAEGLANPERRVQVIAQLRNDIPTLAA